MSKTKKQDNIFTEVVNKKFSRRSFIKWSSAIGATAAASGLIHQAVQTAGAYTDSPAAGKNGSVVQWKPNCCLICHSWCAQAVGVDVYGHIRKIEGQGGQPKTYSNGNPVIHEQPSAGHVVGAVAAKPDDANHIAVGGGYLAFAPHNKGRICAKGNDGMETTYDPDRVKYPLVRSGARGSGRWKRVSWEYALKDYFAPVLRELGNRNGKDLRHRVVWWAGRNESGGYMARWTKAYGTPNRIEHTSICELNRHVAAVSMWNHHWSSVDIQTHTDGHTIKGPTETGVISGGYTFHDDNDIDFYVEVGGNPAECKIPHSTWANHLGDRKKKNLQGYSYLADDAAGYELNERKGRIVCIDVRQTNTAAFADEYFMINPTTDGALFLAMFWYAVNCFPGGSAALKAELDASHMNVSPATNDGRRYYGLFTTEETGNPGAGSFPVPTGKSLESVVNGANPQGAPYNIAWAAAETSIPAADIVYLARAVLGLNVNGAYNGADLTDYWTDASPSRRFANAVIDGYRGPSQLSNGVYTYKSIRAMQIVAANQSACHYWGGRGAPVKARGGYNAPGAFISDGQWTPYGSGGGVPGLGGDPGTSYTNYNSTLPAEQMAQKPTPYQRIDNWDYDQDLPRWRGAYDRWVDQNTVAAMRHSVGLHPYKQGVQIDLPNNRASAPVKGPYYYKDWKNQGLGTLDPDFQVEVLINHKNSPSYARPNQDLDIELFTSKWPAGHPNQGEYRLKHFVSIDLCVGDGTRFADLILPDTSTYERYVERSGEGQEMNYRNNLFNRLPSIEWNNETIGGTTVPRYLYDSRPVRTIHYELARYIETTGVATGGGVAPWNGKLYDSFKWVAGDTGNLATNAGYINDGAYANKNWFEQKATALNAHAALHGAANGFDFMMNQGMLWNSDDVPAYWRQNYNSGKTGSSAAVYAPGSGLKGNAVGEKDKLTVYSSILASLPDVVDSTGANVATYHTDPVTKCFYGSPVYLKSTQKVTSEFTLSLTTYKVNVHTQSRTAQSPRLMEMIGDNWAVISPATAAANGGITSGDKVKVVTQQGSIILEAKVTPRAQNDCVHVSQSLGHRASTDAIPQAAFGNYQVSEDNGATFKPNREQSTYLRNPVPSYIDSDVLAIPPSAPGKGVHPNIVINLHSGPADFTNELAADPIGAGIAWGGTKCRIELVP